MTSGGFTHFGEWGGAHGDEFQEVAKLTIFYTERKNTLLQYKWKKNA